ncbi:MAG: hypothetical protein NTZ60_01135, partial [Campylobacterales bacterium]|nr:hypothetical protein [Campylobacterales bacterium]
VEAESQGSQSLNAGNLEPAERRARAHAAGDQQRHAIKALIQNAMKKHFGWNDTAKVYESVYNEALQQKRQR